MRYFKVSRQAGGFEVYAIDEGQEDYIPDDGQEVTEAEALEVIAAQAPDQALTRIAQIDAELAQIDAKRMRSISDVTLALASGNPAPQAAFDKLAALEADAAELRAKRQPLSD